MNTSILISGRLQKINNLTECQKAAFMANKCKGIFQTPHQSKHPNFTKGGNPSVSPKTYTADGEVGLTLGAGCAE